MKTDFLVIGSGAAGLSFALKAVTEDLGSEERRGGKEGCSYY